MKVWRLTAAVAVAAVLGACSGGKSTAKSGDDALDAPKGCPDEDPFCDEKESDSDSGGSSDSGSSDADDSGGGSTSGTSAFGSGASPTTPTVKQFGIVIAVSRPEPPPAPAAKDGKDGKDTKPAAKPAKPEEKKPGTLKLHPGGMAFGMSSEQIAKLYDRAFDKIYNELYKTTPIGPQTEALDNELSEKKAQLRRSLLDFGTLPTGVDNTALKGEYSYNNDESMSRLDLENGVVRHFFFFGDRLWKIYDEHGLGAGKPLGTSFDTAVTYVEEKLGVKSKRLPADFGVGRNFDQAEWSDGTIILRLLNRDPVVAVVFIDASVEKKLPTLRKNRKSDPTAVDATVRDATRPPPPPPDTKKKK